MYSLHVSYSKQFEIRKNDRDYRVGDLIKPVSVDEDLNKMEHPINNRLYVITYMICDWSDALKDGYCVLGIKVCDVVTRG